LKAKALQIVELAKQVKANDIVVLDLRKICNFCDYFVICSGTSGTHIKAIADEINAGLKEKGVKSHHREGYRESRWIVLDFMSVIVHIFDEDTRDFYNLENLWKEAKKVNLNPKKTRKK
jgi:ribosome-associated protein